MEGGITKVRSSRYKRSLKKRENGGLNRRRMRPAQALMTASQTEGGAEGGFIQHPGRHHKYGGENEGASPQRVYIGVWV